MNKRLILVKLGGSLITDKEKEDTSRPEIITQCVRQIAAVKEAFPDTDMIIGTGAGSYGHIKAHSYSLREGAVRAEQFYGMCVIHNNVRRLNELVVSELTDNQLPAFSISPSAIMTAKGKTIDSSYFESLRQLLSSGCIPLLHGDAVLDSVRGLTIMSTEKVLQACLEALRDAYEHITVIYCMDADGIWDESHHVIPVLKKGQELFVHQSGIKDVTGGIQEKVVSARKAAAIADMVYLVSGKEENALLKAVEGKEVGTQVL